jgi:aminomethyltransferase
VTQPEFVYHLALRELHTAAGASFRIHAGWSQPAHYGAQAAEYAALRESVATFDRSARSRFMVTGTDALDVLRGTFAGHIEDLDEGRAMRAARLDAGGLIRDLALIARIGGIAYLVIGEPGQRTETAAALAEAKRDDFDVRIDDRTDSTCLVAVAGPEAADFVREHLADALPARLQLLHCVAFEFHGFRALAIRTSDTGEDGFEFMLAPGVAQHVFETLTGAGARFAGLDALEAARVEACIPAFDPDLAPGLSPGEAEIEHLLDIPGGRTRWSLAAALFEGQETPPPAGTTLSIEGAIAGEVRSAVYAPALGALAGLVKVEAHLATPGRTLDADGWTTTIVAKPLFRRRS